MYTSQEETKWWALRWKFTRQWKWEKSEIYRHLAKDMYRNLIVAAFTHLFNHRLAQKRKVI